MNWNKKPTDKDIQDMREYLIRIKARKQNDIAQLSEYEMDSYYDRYLKKFDGGEL